MLLVRGCVDGVERRHCLRWLAAAPQEVSLAAARRGERERRERLCWEKVHENYSVGLSSTGLEQSVKARLGNS